jgi:hypothetical protein
MNQGDLTVDTKFNDDDVRRVLRENAPLDVMPSRYDVIFRRLGKGTMAESIATVIDETFGPDVSMHASLDELHSLAQVALDAITQHDVWHSLRNRIKRQEGM